MLFLPALFAPHHRLRAGITARWSERTDSGTGKRRLQASALGWVQRLKRVFSINVERCDRCGGAGHGRKYGKRTLQPSRPRPSGVGTTCQATPFTVETEEFTDFTPPKPVECREHYEKRWFILPMPSSHFPRALRKANIPLRLGFVPDIDMIHFNTDLLYTRAGHRLREAWLDRRFTLTDLERAYQLGMREGAINVLRRRYIKASERVSDALTKISDAHQWPPDAAAALEFNWSPQAARRRPPATDR